MSENNIVNKRGMWIVYCIAAPAFSLTVLCIAPSYVFNFKFIIIGVSDLFINSFN